MKNCCLTYPANLTIAFMLFPVYLGAQDPGPDPMRSAAVPFQEGLHHH